MLIGRYNNLIFEQTRANKYVVYLEHWCKNPYCELIMISRNYNIAFAEYIHQKV